MRMTARLLAALAGVVLLAGCGGGGGGSNAPVTNPTPPVVQPTPTGAAVSAPALGSFTATLAEDISSVVVGGTVMYTLTLANTSSAAATITADTHGTAPVPQGSLHVTDAGGATIYPPTTHPLDAPPAPPTSGVVTLQPGEKITRVISLAIFSKAGTDQAVASFSVASSPADASQTVTLSPLSVTVH